jgi:hypothetical protein
MTDSASYHLPDGRHHVKTHELTLFRSILIFAAKIIALISGAVSFTAKTI